MLGNHFAAVLVPGLNISLDGQLGAGKTHFVKATCGGLGIDVRLVNSPTFVLLQIYEDGRLPVAHFDTYRLADFDEFIAIGGEEYLLDQQVVCFVEWAERIAEVIPKGHLKIEITQVAETSRSFHFVASDDGSGQLLRELKQRLSQERGAT